MFDAEERNRFRLPWRDLLHGIDDLLKLRTLDKLIDRLEGEKQTVKTLALSSRNSILHAMEQTRVICIEAQPFGKSNAEFIFLRSLVAPHFCFAADFSLNVLGSLAVALVLRVTVALCFLSVFLNFRW